MYRKNRVVVPLRPSTPSKPVWQTKITVWATNERELTPGTSWCLYGLYDGDQELRASEALAIALTKFRHVRKVTTVTVSPS